MSKIGFYTQFLQISFLSEGTFRKAKAFSLLLSGALLCTPAMLYRLHPDHMSDVVLWKCPAKDDSAVVVWVLVCPMTEHVTGAFLKDLEIKR